ncbi:MAG TPA: tRNA uridine-5-carboxymethylaminomethyl(34) synthesis GTPase MnmE, partial [Candidatus Ozemobacteraceae bacterium]|nr:tRNA uridine-5-carboxymethylaminomethyl(34) synthesis GTPase MnmE [Candidatus Ozemobacteraceae bacterium]
MIRISGPETFAILKQVFRYNGKRAFPGPFAVFPGHLQDPGDGSAIDQVLVTTFCSPASYTGEDMAEITLHGNPVLLSTALSALFQAGAHPAEPGEFIRRAFLNGKLDLLEVEGVSQLLSAVTRTQAQIALHQLDGLPSQRIRTIRETLLERLTHLEATLNFPEEAIDDLDQQQLAAPLRQATAELERFLAAARQGSLLAAGLRLVLIGKPNTGKSSLLNRLIGRERAIVTEIPGTTRDTLEEIFSLGGLPVRLIDTAGLRNSDDRLEQLGIERTREAVAGAFFLIVLFDRSEPFTDEDHFTLELVRNSNKPFVMALSKGDLPDRFSHAPTEVTQALVLSTRTGQGIQELTDLVARRLRELEPGSLDELMFLGAQQLASLAKALGMLHSLLQNLDHLYQDLIAVELEGIIRE